jgi:glycosyltransferase involved in cell wall biosynthesis
MLFLYSNRYFKYLKNEKFKILVLTDFHKNLFKNITGKKAFTFRNFLPHQKIIDSKKANFITYAGRISEEKGILEMIKVYSEIKNPKYKLNIIGTGPLLNKLNINNKNIILVGETSHSEVLRVINSSKCVITNTKLFEGQPTLLSEASSLGVASIFPDTGGLMEVFEDDYPLSFEQFNYKKLKILLESLNDETLEKAGQSAKKYYDISLDSKNFLHSFKLLITS